MGTINQGILGGVSGKVGNVVGGSWKGIDYLRIMPASVANPKTEAQMDQRSKFVTVLNFLQPFADFVKVGYRNYAVKMTQFNSAMSYNLKNAISGVYPEYGIDYGQALVSRGSLAGALNPSVEMTGPNALTYAWVDNSSDGNANVTDKVMVLACNPSKKEAVYVTEGVERTEQSQVLSFPSNWEGDSAECYIAFRALDGSVSNSKYIGSFEIAMPN